MDDRTRDVRWPTEEPDVAELPGAKPHGGATVRWYLDEAHANLAATGVQRMLMDLVRAGREDAVVFPIEEPKAAAAPTQRATVGELADAAASRSAGADQRTTTATLYRSPQHPDQPWSLGLGFDSHLATLVAGGEPPVGAADAALAAAGLRRIADWRPHFPRGDWGWHTATVTTDSAQ